MGHIKHVISVAEGHWNGQDTLFTAAVGWGWPTIAAGGAPVRAVSLNPTRYVKLKSSALPVDEITDWHAKPIKYVFCKFCNEAKCYVKIFTDAEWL